ncbi:DUF4097 family beta strand repeat-containing protein [Gephyromycinifex aptenodytis]|uniref:DUF4097 family beta strand repeat-containing protein n=1 Tax=Gephyromycinifex aptenodytis TaxID=2716227 RepID=UPI001447DD11|nr:DUF4097 family beta strand repeat-containing protein [Gephyromycinifex aptenodytis]
MDVQIDHPTRKTLGEPGQQVRSVSVALPAGSLDVVTHADPNSAILEVDEVGGAPITVSFEQGVLKIEQYKDANGQVWGPLKGILGATVGAAFGGGQAGVTSRVTLTLPRAAKLSVKTVTADVLVGGLDGSVSAYGVSGSLTLDRLAGSLDVNLVSGDLEAASCSGELKAKTVSGRITVQDSPLRSIKLNSVSGAAIIDLSSGRCLITANAVSGDLTIRMPAAAGYDATVTSTSGHVVIDGQTLHSEDGKRGGHTHEGDRSVAIKARTVSGNVVVLREDPPPSAGPGPVVAQPHPDIDDVQDVRPQTPDSDEEI